jgi:hypothetical protein
MTNVPIPDAAQRATKWSLSASTRVSRRAMAPLIGDHQSL